MAPREERPISMADLLPSSPDVDRPDGGPRVIGLDSEDADELLSALNSETARRILAELHEQPRTPSALADRVDTSLQNAQYHLENLEEAGLIGVADTAYSEKGREMNVYAPADRAFVVVAGPEEETTGLRAALSRLIGGLGALALGSAVVDRLARRGVPLSSGRPDGVSDGDRADRDGGTGGGADGDAAEVTAESAGDAATPTAEPTAAADATDGGPGVGEATTQTPAATDTATAADVARTVTESAGGNGALDPATVVGALAASPGLLFFLGGATVLLVAFVAWLRE